MAIEDFRKYVEDDDYEFAYATVDFVSSKPNSHMHKYSEDVIKKYAPSVLGKWVVGEYDGYDIPRMLRFSDSTPEQNAKRRSVRIITGLRGFFTHNYPRRAIFNYYKRQL